MMHIDILSLFPSYFEGPFQVSMLKRAIEKGLLHINQVDIREFSTDKHKKVDDRPFGGGPGMVMMPQPTIDAIHSVKRENSHVIYLSPQGERLTSGKCQQLAKKEHLVLLSGHYEGVDQRVIDSEIDEEISIGDYVLTNGCVATVVLIDAISRFIDGTLGHPEGAYQDSFADIIFEGPQYTRPEIFNGLKVPSVLLNGNHKQIDQWKLKMGLQKTRKVRPDLYDKYKLKQMLHTRQVKETIK